MQIITKNNQKYLIFQKKEYELEEIENSLYETKIGNEKIIIDPEGILVCPECLESLEIFSQTRYDYLTWSYDPDRGSYEEVITPDAIKPRCHKCEARLPWVYGELAGYEREKKWQEH